MRSLFFALWFFLPAGIANAVPVFAAKIPRLRNLNLPLDFGKSFRGKRIFGDNKTWRGLVSGIVAASAIVLLQRFLIQQNTAIQALVPHVDYNSTHVLWLGPLFGAGALLGDAVESFFKRQAGIKPGDSWFPFDQSDYIIAGLLASAIIVRLDIRLYLTVFGMWFMVHVVATYIGYRIGLREKPI